VQAMFTAIARQRAAEGRPVTAATLARIKATLRAALNAAAIRAGYLTGNPACHTELPSGRRPRPVVWTSDRVREWQRTGIQPAGSGLAARADRTVPERDPGPPAVRGLPPDRAPACAAARQPDCAGVMSTSPAPPS
jgi:hypothetical protein